MKTFFIWIMWTFLDGHFFTTKVGATNRICREYSTSLMCRWTPKVLLYNCSGAHTKLNYICIPSNTSTLDLSNIYQPRLVNGLFKHLSNLERLLLQAAGIITIQRAAFQKLSKLTDLNMTGNVLTSIHENMLQPLVNLRQLHLANCHLKLLPEAIFHNLSRLEFLDVSNNQIGSFQPALFKPLTGLKTLLAAKNPVGDVTAITHVGSLKALHKLDLSECQIRTFSLNSLCEAPKLYELVLNHNFIQLNRSVFNCAAPSSMQVLLLHFNSQEDQTLKDKTFEKLSNLKQLYLSVCNLVIIEPLAFYNLKNLIHFAFNWNYFRSFPSFTDENHHSYLPNLQIFLSTYGGLASNWNIQIYGLPNIKDLQLENNFYRTVGIRGNFSQLERLNLDRNPFEVVAKDPFYSVTNLKTLLMSHCSYDFKEKDRYMFHPLVNLQHLQIDKNSFQKIRSDVLPIFFEKMCQLQTWNMASNQIKTITANWITCKTQLRELNLMDNKIKSWKSNTFIKSPIQILNLQNNLVTSITKDMFLPLTYSLTRLEANKNQFTCNCDMQWFANWIRRHGANIVDTATYTCSDPNTSKKILLAVYQSTPSQCTNLSQVLPSLCAIIVFIFCIIIVVRKRRYIRYWCFIIRLKRNNDTLLSDMAKEYQFDAFLSYSTHDLNWVKPFVERVEKQNKAKLCIHSRDFLTGRFITENIMEGIENSRKTIIVLSRNYIRSKWCDFEINMAHTKQVEGNSCFLILIMLETIPISELTATLKYLIQHRTYLEWKENDDEVQHDFWSRIDKELPKPTDNLITEPNADTLVRVYQQSS